jgi:ketosteroid isomerase-like protein
MLMRRVTPAVVASLLVTVAVTAQTGDPIPPALAAMADTERAFAQTAKVKGWRDAFLDFFADDAIAFGPEVMSAKDGLRKQPSRPFSERELLWEPRTGDVAASGELGWLTGPSTSIDHTTPEATPRYGCYLSIWRKQPDGHWRVFIDVGAGAAEAVTFAPGFTRIALENRYRGSEGKEAATKSLGDADRDLNAQIADQGIPTAFGARIAPAARLHRPGNLPIVGRDAIAAWLPANATAGTAAQTAFEAASSGDFGYSYGRFTITAPNSHTGVYIRLWSRDASGRWWLMADVAQFFKPA